MKKLYFLLFALSITAFTFGQDMVITGAFDGPLTGGTPKLVEIYVISDIADLSTYGFGSANNGGGSDGQELAFAGSATAGDFIYIAYEGQSPNDNPGSTNAYFSITPDYIDGSASINGDDALELFNNGVVIDTFGDINTDGSGQPWDYLDGWAYRNNGTGPDGTTFTLANWTFSGINAADGCTDNATCASVFPIGTYSVTPPACTLTFNTETYTCGSNTIGDNNDGVTINISYNNSDAGITSVTTTSGGTVGGDDPASVSDGTITISGLMEGAAWDITINGGDCDGTTTSGTVEAAICDPAPTTCFDLSGGAELFESVTVVPNIDMDEWTESSGTYSMNGYCGGGCAEQIETWLVFGPLDMTSVSDLDLSLVATEQFGVTDLVIAYTSSYSGCPSTTTWTTAQTLTATGDYDIDVSAATGTDVYIGIQYLDDGADGYSGWSLSNVALNAYGTCPTLGTRTASSCPLSVDENNINGFSIYPNPTNKGYVNISSRINSKMNVSVYDILGKQVITKTISNNILDVSNLNTGIYIMKITQGKATSTKKLVIK